MTNDGSHRRAGQRVGDGEPCSLEAVVCGREVRCCVRSLFVTDVAGELGWWDSVGGERETGGDVVGCEVSDWSNGTDSTHLV